MTSESSKASRQAMMVARSTLLPNEREINLTEFQKNNHHLVPHVVYHGTDRDFYEFNSKAKSNFDKIPFDENNNDLGWFSKGFYFTPHKKVASYYADPNKSNRFGAQVMPVHLSLKNPFIVNIKDYESGASSLNDALNRIGAPQDGNNYHRRPSFQTAYLKSLGHDGVIATRGGRPEEYVVFDPGQIKSAIGNQGTFNPNNPDITKSNGGMTSDPKKAARAALYVARKTFADGGGADDAFDIQNPTSVFPKPQRMWDTPMPGGAYLSMPSKEDITGHKAAQASVGIKPGGKPFFNVSRDAVEQTGSPGRGSALVKTNLFKQKAGWQWVNAPEGHEDTNTLVSVEHRGKHHYALTAHFPKGVDLARYADAPSEPRLRPTTQGNVFLGPQVGSIAVRGREHPVYKHIVAKADGGSVTSNPNFHAWFGDSVLHDDGVPRTYYTGTSKDKDFTSFNVGRHGAWFTTDPKEASEYAMQNDSQGYTWEGGGYKKTNTASRVIPAYLKASNPYTGERPHHIIHAQNYKKAQSDWFDQLRAAGHDAWVPASMNGNLAVMLKHPTQIKSAIGNNGNFDPKSPHIAKAAGGITDDDAFTAYHGTPHTFEPEPDAPYGRFRDTAIGSGEGAQAYGYGHYLAGNEGIAKGYQERLAKTSAEFTPPSERIKIGGKNLSELMPNASRTVVSLIAGSLEAHNGDLKSAYKTLSERGNKSPLQNALSSIAAKEIEPHLDKKVSYQEPYKGHLLETRVRAKPEHFLDWDKPLSEQHPHVQNVIKSFYNDDVPLKNKYSERLKGEDYYNHMVSAAGGILHKKKLDNAGIPAQMPGGIHQRLSYYLSSIGIPGIRYLDAGSRGAGAGTHNYVVFDPKNIDIVKRYAQGGEVYSNHAPRHTMQSPAVAELKHLLTVHRDELRRMKGRAQYGAIDGIMKRISHEHGIAPSRLHDDWMSVYHQTPDAWVAGDPGSIVDRALKMTNRGGYAGGGAPINFAPAASAFVDLPSIELASLGPSAATRERILAPRRTYMPSDVSDSPPPQAYIPPSIPAPVFRSSSYDLPHDDTLLSAVGVGSRDEQGAGAAHGGRVHRADGGEADLQLPEPAPASMPSKRKTPFGVTAPQGAVPAPMTQATRNLTQPGQVTIKSMSDAFNRAISNHLSLSPGERITNARQAAQNISEFLGSGKTGKMNALLTASGKLMKAAKSQSGKEPVTIPDGRGVETLGLSLFPDFKEGQFRVCGNSDSCRDSCIGKKSNAYGMDPTQASDPIPLTKQEREGMGGKPRMAALARTHALMRDPESFAVYLHDLIDHEKIAAARRGNLLGVRLNTLSDVPPSVWAPIIKAHPDVAFYDYTKMNYDPVAPNHHYTYSSTGLSQPDLGVENPFQNWHKSRDRLDQGENVAMAFSHKSGEAFPRMIHDEETGRHYRVVSGDEHDFRPLDIQGEGKSGVIVALKNIAKDLGHETAAQKSNGFFVHHDPGFLKDKKGNFAKDENGNRIPQNLIYTVRAQQKKRMPSIVFKRSDQND